MRRINLMEDGSWDQYMTISKDHFRDPKEVTVTSSRTGGEKCCSCAEKQQQGIKLFTGEVFFGIPTQSLPCHCQNGKPPTDKTSVDETKMGIKSAGETTTSTKEKGSEPVSVLEVFMKEFPPLSPTESRSRHTFGTPGSCSLLSLELTQQTSNSHVKFMPGRRSRSTNEGMAVSVSTSSGSDVKWDLVPVLNGLKEKLAKAQSPSALFHVNSPGIVAHRNGDWNWNRPGYIRLPLDSAFVKTEVDSVSNSSRKIPRWNLIRDELTELGLLCRTDFDPSKVNVGMQIKKAVSVYNMRLASQCDFLLLNHPELSHRLRECLPNIVTHALKLANMLATPIPILKRGNPHTLYLTRELVCSLLANGFFCMMPDQVENELPNFNFYKLFDSSSLDEKWMAKVEMLKCILEYFSQSNKDEDKHNIISYERRCIFIYQNWHCSGSRLSELKVELRHGIEHSEGMLQVDFGNRRVGGGVLAKGMGMEEIRFCTTPELIVARLFTETLGDDEVLVVTGTKQFSSYSGYSSTFKFEPMEEQRKQLKKDQLGRDFTQVVVMDAIHFQSFERRKQYQRIKIERELHKCYVAFIPGKHVTPVATGNWGCGEFDGDPQLKFLIQWIAASQHNRPLVFCTDSISQQKELIEIAKILFKKNILVGHLYQMLVKYEYTVPVPLYSSMCPSLFDYIKCHVSKERN